MEELYITKLIKNGNSLSVVIPKHILKANRWERGDQLVFAFAGFESLIIKRLSDKELRRLKEPDDIIQLEPLGRGK